MKRRSFVKASLIAGAIPASALAMANKDKKTALQLYELRVYTLKTGNQQKLVQDYYKNAAIPALNRFGINSIGVFTELKPAGQTNVFVITPFSSVEEFMKVQERLYNDADYLQAATDYLNAPATAPAYERIESWLLQSFTGWPKLAVPEKRQQLFELRRYESPTEAAGKKKMEMFNTGGELAIFKKAGLRPVFFGETIIGSLRPNLTYMLTYADMAEHDQNWKAFGGDPEWKKLSSTPEYTDARLISKITATFLVPTDFSQI